MRIVGETIAHVVLNSNTAHVKVREVKVCQAVATMKHRNHIRHIRGVEVGEVEAR